MNGGGYALKEEEENFDEFEEKPDKDIDDLLGEEFLKNIQPPKDDQASEIRNSPLGDELTSEMENRQPRRIEEKEVKVVGVYEHQEQGAETGFPREAYFVILRDNKARQVLIWIGRFEAYAIEAALERANFIRPMTHDLLKTVVERLGGRVEKILIDDIWHDTYYAKISVSVGDETIDIDARPSDALALALRAEVPIYMDESVLKSASVSEDS